ncbi:M56 family metallopeptidase [Alteromonadaceae bacterium BrNp21-10]|nr:M56 family metallopeptidase [Alteromonadaceae bacterium BrNp21-10]
MTNWILAQQVILSITLLLLLILERHWQSEIGANNLYRFWLLIPAALLINNIPHDIIAVGNNVIQQYVVTLTQQTQNIALSLSWQLIWASGAAMIMLYALWSNWRMQQLPVKHCDKANLAITTPKSLQVLSSTAVSSPVLCGLLPARLILPANFNDSYSPEQQRLILQHEVVHYRRGDNLFNLFALCLLSLFWFNPLMWLAYKAFRRNQELACDDKVLKHCTVAERISYSKALVQCAEQSLQPFSIYTPYGEKSTMKTRLQFIQQRALIKPLAIVTSLIFGGVMLTGIAIAKQQPTKQVEVSQLAEPVLRVEPKYPAIAVQKKWQGSVVLQFDISQTGATENVKVIKSQPENVFDAASIEALSQWQYKPRIVGGKAQTQRDMLVQLDYQLQQEPASLPSMVEGITVTK